MWVPECVGAFPGIISNVHGVVGSLLLQFVFKYNLSVMVLGISFATGSARGRGWGELSEDPLSLVSREEAGCGNDLCLLASSVIKI